MIAKAQAWCPPASPESMTPAEIAAAAVMAANLERQPQLGDFGVRPFVSARHSSAKLIGGGFRRSEALILSALSKGARDRADEKVAQDPGIRVTIPCAEVPFCSAAARRMRRHRVRRREGLRCLTIELREAQIDAFIRRKQLCPEDRANPDALRRALYQYLYRVLW